MINQQAKGIAAVAILLAVPFWTVYHIATEHHGPYQTHHHAHSGDHLHQHLHDHVDHSHDDHTPHKSQDHELTTVPFKKVKDQIWLPALTLCAVLGYTPSEPIPFQRPDYLVGPPPKAPPLSPFGARPPPIV